MKILIRLPNWLGDVIMSTAFIAAVRQSYPGAQIDVIIKKELGAIAELIAGIDQIHLFSKNEFEGIKGVHRFGKTLRDEKYDIFFSLPISISSAVMGWSTGAKNRIGFGREGSFFLYTKICRRPKNVHRVDEYLSLLEQFSKTPVTDKKVSIQPSQAVEPNGLVLVNFNSAAVSRRVPLGKAINLINIVTNAFKETNFALIGSPKDIGHIEQVYVNAENKDRLQNLTGKTDLPGLVNLMAGAKAMLSTDSGPAHVANSVGLPVVALFGAGNEHNTAPYNKENLTVLRANQLDCEPCVRNTCELYGVPKCMKLISEIKIIYALNEYLTHA